MDILRNGLWQENPELVQLLAGDGGLLAARVYLAIMAPLAVTVAGWTIFRSHRAAGAEREFAEWYRVPNGRDLVFVAVGFGLSNGQLPPLVVPCLRAAVAHHVPTITHCWYA